MNVKIFMHLMPWELDDALPAFNRIALANKYLPNDITLTVETCLNLSDYIINWSATQIPKQFFVDKYNYINRAFYETKHKMHIYEKNELYGHLDFQREIVEPDVDYYMSVCPDVYFHHHTIVYLIQGVQQISDKYFLITPEIPKLWDASWDILTNKHFQNEDHSKWQERNINDIIYTAENFTDSPFVEKINELKWAGWCDIYNKNFYEKLVPCLKSWHGYGPWDFFGINVCTLAKQQFNINFNQYVLRNQVIFDKDIGVFQNKKIPNPYKKYISLYKIEDQRITFETNFNKSLQEWFEQAKNNNII